MSEAAARSAGWTTVAFGDVVRQVKDKVDPEESGLERYVAGEHMDTDDLRIRRWGEIGDSYLGPAFHMRFKPGHVLYGSRRTYLRKVALADFEGITANTTYVLESKDADVLLPELLPFIMQVESFHEHSKRESKGSVNPYVNFSDLAWYEVALPPMAEQWRISELLRSAANLRETLLCAKLSAETLLRSAVDAAAEKAADSQSMLSLADLVSQDRPICYGILMPGNGFEGGVPVVKVKDYPDGEVVVDGLLLTDPVIDEDYKRSRLRTGDLLISIRGTIGRLAFVPKALDGANITQDTARLSISPEHNSRYIRAMLECTLVQRQISTFITGLAVKGINIGELRRIQIPIVSSEEQQEVVQEVIDVRAAIRGIEKRLAQSETLLKACLAEHLGGD